MSSLADLPELVGFFSYSRQDDEDSLGGLSKLRDRIHRELGMRLGRHRHDFRLWQDKAAIPYGTLWKDEIERAVAESVFFIPIVTPRTVRSEYCKFEFESFLARETALGRANLVFPILYIEVPDLDTEQVWRNDEVLRIIRDRQYVDWRDYRRQDVGSPEVGWQIELFCKTIVEALRQPWAPPAAPIKQELEAPQKLPEPAPERGIVGVRSIAGEEAKPPAPIANVDKIEETVLSSPAEIVDTTEVATFAEPNPQKPLAAQEQMGAKALMAVPEATRQETPASRPEPENATARPNPSSLATYTGIGLIGFGAISALLGSIILIKIVISAGLAFVTSSFFFIPALLGLFIMIDVASACLGIGALRQWRRLAIPGLVICGLGTARDIFAGWFSAYSISQGALALLSSGFEMSFFMAWWFLFQSLSLAAHALGIVYFWRQMRKNREKRPSAHPSFLARCLKRLRRAIHPTRPPASA